MKKRIKIKVPAFEFEAVVHQNNRAKSSFTDKEFVRFEIDTFEHNLKEVLDKVISEAYRKVLKQKGRAEVVGWNSHFPSTVYFYKD